MTARETTGLTNIADRKRRELHARRQNGGGGLGFETKVGSPRRCPDDGAAAFFESRPTAVGARARQVRRKNIVVRTNHVHTGREIGGDVAENRVCDTANVCRRSVVRGALPTPKLLT